MFTLLLRGTIVNPLLGTAVRFWGQTTQISSRLPPKLDCGSKGVNRAYGIHKNLYISLFLLAIFGPINYGPP